MGARDEVAGLAHHTPGIEPVVGVVQGRFHEVVEREEPSCFDPSSEAVAQAGGPAGVGGGPRRHHDRKIAARPAARQLAAGSDAGIMVRVEPSAGLRVLRVLAPNPGPFTLEGTNTWVAGSEGCLVIDPGPEDPTHEDAVLQASGPVAAILLTHRHLDHASGAGALARVTGAPIYAASPGEGARAAGDGDRIEGAGVTLEVVATPGHSPDHLVFFEPVTGALFTGDAILGRGTSVIDPPEGDLSDYLRSLERMRRLGPRVIRSEEHTSELQSRGHLVCRLLLE